MKWIMWTVLSTLSFPVMAGEISVELSINTLWIVMAAAPIFFMQTDFSLLEVVCHG